MSKHEALSLEQTLRLALEALENLGNHDHVCPQWPTYAEPENYPKCNCGYDQAITAIKAALEAKDESLVWNGGVPAMLPKQKEGETFIVSYEPKLEAKDEPAAWMNKYGACKTSLFRDVEAGAKEEYTIPLYTTPPQRTWVGLTAEEREQVQAESYGKVPHHVALIAAVEAILKEKNT